jgi:hypothetical protein
LWLKKDIVLVCQTSVLNYFKCVESQFENHCKSGAFWVQSSLWDIFLKNLQIVSLDIAETADLIWFL